MHESSLDTIVSRLLEPLARSHEELNHTLLALLARGKPFEKNALAAALHLSPEELEQRLARLPDLELDAQGRIVGWGVTLVPTRHRFHIQGQDLFAWCAFDTVLYPPQLQAEAQVYSTCPVTGRAISFVATPDGNIKNLSQETCVLSLLIPTEQRHCGRAGFCEPSLFFWDEHAAAHFLASHPEAILLSIEEAAYVGKRIAQHRTGGVSENTEEATRLSRQIDHQRFSDEHVRRCIICSRQGFLYRRMRRKAIHDLEKTEQEMFHATDTIRSHCASDLSTTGPLSAQYPTVCSACPPPRARPARCPGTTGATAPVGP